MYSLCRYMLPGVDGMVKHIGVLSYERLEGRIGIAG